MRRIAKNPGSCSCSNFLEKVSFGKKWIRGKPSRKTLDLELIAQNKSLNTPYFCDPKVFQTIFLHFAVYGRSTIHLGDGPRKLYMFFYLSHEILIDVNAQTLNLNRPYKFGKLTNLEVRIQTFQILTQRQSCASNVCSRTVPLTDWHSCALTSIQDMLNTHSKVFMHTP